MNLHDLQQALQSHILDGDDAIERWVSGDEGLSAQGRLGIYRHAYLARLVESLGQTYPALAHVLGEEPFQQQARQFVRSQPSHHTSIRYYGREFADFLHDHVSGPAGEMLADLAHWEWTLAAAFDGPDATVLPVDALANVHPQDWARLQLRLHGSLQRIGLTTNAVEWWRAATQDAPRPDGPWRTPRLEWVVWRHGLTTSFRSLARDEAQALDAALRGWPFADLCAVVAQFVGDDAAPLRAATLLKSWLTEGWVAGVDVAR